jgi:hypothetical protein
MCDRLFSPGEASDRAYVNLRDMREEWIVPVPIGNPVPFEKMAVIRC